MTERTIQSSWMRLWFQDMDCLESLNDVDHRRVIHALRVVAETGEETPLEGAARMAYNFMANRVRQDCEAYLKTCERNRENGKKRKASGTQWEPVDATGAEVRSKKQEVRSENNNSSPPSESKKLDKKPKNNIEMENRFDEFWRDYPRKQAKQEAHKAFMAPSPDEVTHARMLEAIRRQKAGEQWKDPQFIPHPATWIRGKRWEDETASSPSAQFQNLKGMVML